MMGMHPMRSIVLTLDRMTMYRVVLYALFAVIVMAFLLAAFDALPYGPFDMAISLVVMIAAALVAHGLCSRIAKAPANIESSFITAFILFLIITPAQSSKALLVSAAVTAAAISLKYVVVHRKRHLFNPAALALLLAGLFGYVGADWWVGSRYMLPIVLVAAVLVVTKVRRWELFLAYVVGSAAIVTLWFLDSSSPLDTLTRHFLSWPTIFFAGIMLTEPLGLPSTKRLQYVFAFFVAALSSVPFHIGSFYGTPELALVLGNLFTFIVDRPERLVLRFSHRTEIGPRSYEYHFAPPHPIAHRPGQYLEWTLPHAKPDLRSIRRYFTIVSEPQHETLSFAVRHVPKQSTFKEALERLQPGALMYATQRAGDFLLQTNSPHHVWIAGGIGITPFISMTRDLRARSERISATLFNCNKTEGDIIFSDELSHAGVAGVNVVNVLVEKPVASVDHELGFLTAEIIQKRVSQWKVATYYISGPPGLVDAYKKLLRGMGIPKRRIITDYFPGLA